MLAANSDLFQPDEPLDMTCTAKSCFDDSVSFVKKAVVPVQWKLPM